MDGAGLPTSVSCSDTGVLPPPRYTPMSTTMPCMPPPHRRRTPLPAPWGTRSSTRHCRLRRTIESVISRIGAGIVSAALALGIAPVAAQSYATCIAYMEADAAYNEAILQLDGDYELAIKYEPDPVLREVRIFLGPPDNPRREAVEARVRAYLDAYGGPTSDVDSVMMELLEANRWHCCKRLEPVKAARRFGCRVQLER